ncbi:uncharacterized protein WCC33_015851 [Rhinophrynus dorsalis]
MVEPVWDHFVALGNGRLAKCRFYGREVSRGRVLGPITTSGMNQHLNTLTLEDFVPSLCRSCVGLLKDLLGKAAGQSVHFTTDLWSAPSDQHGFLSLTAHWWEHHLKQDVGTRWNSTLDMLEHVLPTLSLVAQELLSCPPTTVQSERVFSVAGNILSPLCSHLAPGSWSKLLF